MTRDTWHLTYDTRHVTHGGGEHSLKISGPQLLWFGIDITSNIFPQTITESVNELITEVFVEQPRLHRVC